MPARQSGNLALYIVSLENWHSERDGYPGPVSLKTCPGAGLIRPGMVVSHSFHYEVLPPACAVQACL